MPLVGRTTVEMRLAARRGPRRRAVVSAMDAEEDIANAIVGGEFVRWRGGAFLCGGFRTR